MYNNIRSSRVLVRLRRFFQSCGRANNAAARDALLMLQLYASCTTNGPKCFIPQSNTCREWERERVPQFRTDYAHTRKTLWKCVCVLGLVGLKLKLFESAGAIRNCFRRMLGTKYPTERNGKLCKVDGWCDNVLQCLPETWKETPNRNAEKDAQKKHYYIERVSVTGFNSLFTLNRVCILLGFNKTIPLLPNVNMKMRRQMKRPPKAWGVKSLSEVWPKTVVLYLLLSNFNVAKKSRASVADFFK